MRDDGAFKDTRTNCCITLFCCHFRFRREAKVSKLISFTCICKYSHILKWLVTLASLILIAPKKNLFKKWKLSHNIQGPILLKCVYMYYYSTQLCIYIIYCVWTFQTMSERSFVLCTDFLLLQDFTTCKYSFLMELQVTVKKPFEGWC